MKDFEREELMIRMDERVKTIFNQPASDETNSELGIEDKIEQIAAKEN